VRGGLGFASPQGSLRSAHRLAALAAIGDRRLATGIRLRRAERCDRAVLEPSPGLWPWLWLWLGCPHLAVAVAVAVAICSRLPRGSTLTLPSMHLRGLDPDTPRAHKAAALLEDAVVAWLTTVSPDGRPQSSPVWFVVDEGEFLLYSLAGTPRTRNIAANPRVSLNLDSDAGGDVVVLEGTARIVDGPSSVEHAAYQEKYREHIPRIGHTAETFAERYPVAIRVTPERWRVH
jgi:PPOX class probable F420-dependent enzyme